MDIDVKNYNDDDININKTLKHLLYHRKQIVYLYFNGNLNGDAKDVLINEFNHINKLISEYVGL